MTQAVERTTVIEAPADEVWAWHTRPGALERLTPPWETVTVLEPGRGIAEGSRVVLRMEIGPVPVRWVAVHRGVVEGREFRDEQESGPFESWTHLHRIEPAGAGRAELTERIEFRLPFGAAGALAAGTVRGRLESLLRYRSEVIRHDLAAHRRAALSPLRIAVTGSHGLIGSALVPFLSTGGHEVIRVVRSAPRVGEIGWDPADERIDAERFGGVDAIVHLAGENLAGGRWTPDRKARLVASRVAPTQLLSRALAAARPMPRVLVSASAIGVYGNRSDQPLSESSGPGHGFLAGLARAWEESTAPAAEAGIRVIHSRFGVALSPSGGALAAMLPVFRLGLGGRLGNGWQWMSMQSVDDTLGALLHCIASDGLSGPVNVVSPTPLRNREFTIALARALHRPAPFAVPAQVLRLALGELAEETLLTSQRVFPDALQSSGYQFRYADVPAALGHVLPH